MLQGLYSFFRHIQMCVTNGVIDGQICTYCIFYLVSGFGPVVPMIDFQRYNSFGIYSYFASAMIHHCSALLFTWFWDNISIDTYLQFCGDSVLYIVCILHFVIINMKNCPITSITARDWCISEPYSASFISRINLQLSSLQYHNLYTILSWLVSSNKESNNV